MSPDPRRTFSNVMNESFSEGLGRMVRSANGTSACALQAKVENLDPVNKAKSVVLTEKGLTETERLFKTLFVKTPMPKRKITFDPELAPEAKSIVVFAFRNGPIFDVPVTYAVAIRAGRRRPHPLHWKALAATMSHIYVDCGGRVVQY